MVDDEPEILEDNPDATGRLIRPYAITGGRTDVNKVVQLETTIQATPSRTIDPGRYRWEAAQLIELVVTPMALIEVSARLGVPIGVTKVLVADLLEDGVVMTHVPTMKKSFTSLLEEVLDGVRNL